MNELKTEKSEILLIGIGNCGRNDDALGWKFVDMASQTTNNYFDIEYRYQLQVEDAELVSKYKIVVFADATRITLGKGFEIVHCSKAGHYFFSSHQQTPETILYLADILYHKKPEAYMVAIEGRNWGLGTSISLEAEKNMNKALNDFYKIITASNLQLTNACV